VGDNLAILKLVFFAVWPQAPSRSIRLHLPGEGFVRLAERPTKLEAVQLTEAARDWGWIFVFFSRF